MNDFADINGKVFVITGGAGAGAGGSGAAIAEKLAEHGAYVCLWDIADEKGKAMADSSPLMKYFHCDVTKEEEVRETAEKTAALAGKIDGLVNNAFWHADQQPPLHEVTSEDFDRHMDINLRSHFLVCKYLIPFLLKEKKSVILNIGSTGAHRGEDGYFAYSAAKAGLESLTRNIAAQYGRDGLRCNCLVPGLTLTKEFDSYVASDKTLSEVFHKMDRNNLLREGHMSPSQVADATLFLLSDMSSGITAQNLILDGGAISHSPQWADMRS